MFTGLVAAFSFFNCQRWDYSIDSFGKTEKKNFGKKITDCMQKKQFHEKIRLTNRRKNGLLYSINELLMRDWIMTSEKKKNRKVYVVGHKNPGV